VFQSAVELFVERGYENATMDDIAERAGVARATVFNYYRRKIVFLDEWTEWRRQQAVHALQVEQLATRPTREVLERYMRELANVSTQTRAETVALMTGCVHSLNLFGEPALGYELARYLERGKRRNEIRASIDPQQGGIVLATCYFAVLTQWISDDPQPFDLHDELLKVLDLVLDGLLTPKPSRGSAKD
jgi:AcrR family transcriptional regulator